MDKGGREEPSSREDSGDGGPHGRAGNIVIYCDDDGRLPLVVVVNMVGLETL